RGDISAEFGSVIDGIGKINACSQRRDTNSPFHAKRHQINRLLCEIWFEDSLADLGKELLLIPEHSFPSEEGILNSPTGPVLLSMQHRQGHIPVRHRIRETSLFEFTPTEGFIRILPGADSHNRRRHLRSRHL